MNAKHLIALLQDNYTTVEVVFEGNKGAHREALTIAYSNASAARDWAHARDWTVQGQLSERAQRTPEDMAGSKRYTYKARLDEGIVVGDVVIVDSPSAGYTCVRVVAVHPSPKIDTTLQSTYKWVVQKVDDGMYLSQLAAEENFLDAMREAERANAREMMVKQAIEGLPEGTLGRKLFEEAVATLTKGAFNLRTLSDGTSSAS